MLIPVLLVNLVIVGVILSAIALGGVGLWYENIPPVSTVRRTLSPDTINSRSMIDRRSMSDHRSMPDRRSKPARFIMSDRHPMSDFISKTDLTSMRDRPSMTNRTPTTNHPSTTIHSATSYPTAYRNITKIVEPKLVCKSKECIAIDANLQKQISTDYNPCEDFHKFACSKAYNVKSSKALINKQFNEVLEKPENHTDIESLKVAKSLYRSCINIKRNESDIIPTLASVFHQTFNDNSSVAMKRFYKLASEIGYLPRSLFVMDFTDYPGKRDQKILFIRKPAYSNEYSYYGLQLDTTSMNLEFMMDWYKRKKLAGYSEALGLKKFESQEKAVKDAYNSDPEAKPVIVSLSELTDESDIIPWKDILDTTFNPLTFSADSKIMVECLPCLQNVTKFVASTSPKAMWAYFLRHAFADVILDSTSEMVEEWFNDQAKKTNNKYFKKQFCTSKIVSLFKKTMNYEYIGENVNRHMGHYLKFLILKLKSAFQIFLQGAKFLDNTSKKRSVGKIDSMRFYTPFDAEAKTHYSHISYPLNFYYRSLNLTRKRNIKIFVNEFMNNHPTGPIQLTQYMVGEEFVHYDLSSNSIFLSATALADLQFSNEGMQYWNFGGLGSIIAYGMVQALIGEGLSYGEDGNKTDLWPSETRSMQDKEAKCFKDSYREHMMKASNPKQETKIVFINDAAQIAYYAYKSIKSDKDLIFPSFKNFSSGKMFWISYASAMCSSALKSIDSDDSISPSIIINEVVSNNYNFSRDFMCKSGAKMNPMEKCNLWLNMK